MPRERKAGQTPRCSFCNRLATQVARLIAGPDVQICDECVRMCAMMLENDGAPRAAERQPAA